MSDTNRANHTDTPTTSGSDRLNSRNRLFHEPRVNKIKSLEEKLKDVKNYVHQEENVDGLPTNYKSMVLKTAALTLNVPTDRKVFKDLPKLDDPEHPVVKRAPQMTEKFSNVNKAKRRSSELQDEINNLLKDFKDDETIDNIKIIPHSIQGIIPNMTPNLLTITKREEDRIFMASLLKLAADLNPPRKDERFEFDFKSLKGFSETS